MSVGAQAAAEAFLGRPIEGDADVRLPGRLEWRGEDELWDGAHTPEAVDWLLERVPGRDWVVVASMLEDKDTAAMLERLARVGHTLVATRSSSPRALPAAELADRARRYVSNVVAVEDPVAAVRRAHELGSRVLVTGSLYLLADLHAAPVSVSVPGHAPRRARRRRRPRSRSGAAGAILFAILALVLFVAAAFATGFLIGKLLI